MARSSLRINWPHALPRKRIIYFLRSACRSPMKNVSSLFAARVYALMEWNRVCDRKQRRNYADLSRSSRKALPSENEVIRCCLSEGVQPGQQNRLHETMLSVEELYNYLPAGNENSLWMLMKRIYFPPFLFDIRLIVYYSFNSADTILMEA